ncbi:MAG: FlgD immunoglobulin-like domain containing protein [Actinomycetota bacterium]
MSVIVATPASASFAAVVELPDTALYSPYGGPATVTFTFDEVDGAAVFTVRLRRLGTGTIEKKKDYLVDPSTQGSPHAVSFSWGKVSVTAPRSYVVDVRRQDGGPVITSAPFTLLPRLVSDLSAKPSPFYPLVDDGYKDTTKIRFSLAADTTDTTIAVFDADTYGRCCGTQVLAEDLGPLAEGARSWTWDGTRDDASSAPKGTYFVRVEATDADDVSVVSKAQKVRVTKGKIRLTATKQKDGSAYARVGDERATAIGGDCSVSRDLPTREARVLCANADVSVFWRWALKPGERIESVSFVVHGGIYGCRRSKGRSGSQSFLRVRTPPTSQCSVVTAEIKYSYPVKA